MFFENNCCIYLYARARISHQKDFRIIDTPKISLYKISLKVNVLGFIFSNILGLHFQNLLRNKHLLGYSFKKIILKALLSLKNMWCLPK